MSLRLAPYPAYRDCGVSWLGRTPNGWDLRRGKFLFRYKKELNFGGSNTNVLSLTLRGVVNNDPNNPEGLVPKDYASYQLFEKGDLVFKLIDLENFRTSRVGVVHEDGIMSPAYIRLAPSSGVDVRYFYYQFFDLYLRGVFNQLGEGVRATLGPRDLLDLGLVLPERREQTTVAQFLDVQERRINRLIRAKRRLIELRNEQKQAIICRAVTRGLDPNVRLKPSGIDWLGDMPEAWEVRKLGHVARVFNGTTPSRTQPRYWDQGNAAWLASGKVNDYVVRTPTDLISEDAVRECSLSLVPKGALILGMVGQGKTRGTSARLAIDAYINQNLAAILPRSGVDGPFLHSMLIAAYGSIREAGRGGNQEALNCEIVRSFRFPLPSLREQVAIGRVVGESTAELDRAIDRTRREIDLLREYRMRLIADVVTGKLDVRGVELPRLDDDGALGEIDLRHDGDPEEPLESGEDADGAD